MPNIHRSALLPYSAQNLYEIVNDVAAYPKFLPWCGATKILSQDQVSMEASILMKKGGVNHWFSTRNQLNPYHSIEIHLVDGPFKQLDGHWKFIELEPQACKIELDLNFAFSHGLVAALVAPVFTHIANTMVDSFCARAFELNPQ